MKLKKMLHRLYSDSGFFLFMVRLPSKIIKFILDRFTTQFYRHSLREVGRSFFIEWGAVIESPKRVSVGDAVHIGKGTRILSESNFGSLRLGNNVEIGRECRIDITGNVIIKDNVLMSRGCQILSHSHGYYPRSIPEPKDLLIEDSVWLGSDVCIMDSCDFIARSSILATRALVTKSILEENSIAAGVPASIIGKSNV
ncbi:acyltransferase [Shewanella sp. AC91-MNA-CIBAN-0169]|uniref:acyltransferase n=1 Tax=Shewanella sp. AC91-MNA-CIBAN-0169 TaxID=3140466 RepID=UPI00332D1241